MDTRFKRNPSDGSLEANIAGVPGLECGTVAALFSDTFVCKHSSERGTICGACIAQLKGRGFQDGYFVGYNKAKEESDNDNAVG